MHKTSSTTATKSNMKQDAKRELMAYLDTGHRHESMTAMSLCKHCGERFKKGEAFYNRLRKEKPELFIYNRPEFKPSKETRNLFAGLMDRIQRDKLYQRHLKRLSRGTEEEKDEEIKKSNEGYYRKHYEEGDNIKKI